jgi:NhaA family Na+:H+ antiporter
VNNDNPRRPGPGPDDDLWQSGPHLMASRRPLARLVARPVREFLRIESSSSVLLIAAAAIALVWANSPWAPSYDALWHTEVAFDVGGWHVAESLQHWVNDALMVIFFFVVGLEIKYELVKGDLRDPRTAALPIVAAVGGMVVPAGLYVLIAAGGDAAHGWGIPMATDIAFAMGVLGVLGRRIPSAARVFLLTLAIVDDIGAIVVIAVFYTADLDLGWLAAAVGFLLLMLAMRAVKVWAIWAYALVGVAMWFATLQSGVHATLAGVAAGLMAPAHALLREDVARGYAQSSLVDRHLNPDELSRLRFLLGESVPVVERIQSALHPLSAYVVLPVFALANAGVDMRGGILGEALSSAVAQGIAAGLVLGKPIGIVLACFIAVRLGLGRLPQGAGWGVVTGVGAVAGVGFTVSLFIAGLSFPGSEQLTADAKVGILGASLVAAVCGIVVLLLTARAPDPDDPHDDGHDDGHDDQHDDQQQTVDDV